MVVGGISGLILGGALPCFVLFWGDMTESFGGTSDEMVNASRDVLFKFIYIAIAALVLGSIMISTWMISGEKQAI
jgi:hypothetical protein